MKIFVPIIGAALIGAALWGDSVKGSPIDYTYVFPRECTYDVPFDLHHRTIRAAFDGNHLIVVGQEAESSKDRIIRFKRCESSYEDITEKLLPSEQKVVQVSAVTFAPRWFRTDDLIVVYDVYDPRFITDTHPSNRASFLQRFNRRSLKRRREPVQIFKGHPADQPVWEIYPLTGKRWLLATQRIENDEVTTLHIIDRDGRLEGSFFPLPRRALEVCTGGNPFAQGAHEGRVAVLHDGRIVASNPWESRLQLFENAEWEGPVGPEFPGYVEPPIHACRGLFDNREHFHDAVSRYTWFRMWTPVADVMALGGNYVLKATYLKKDAPDFYDWGLEILDSDFNRVALTSLHDSIPLTTDGKTLLSWTSVISRSGKKTIRLFQDRFHPRRIPDAPPDPRWRYRRPVIDTARIDVALWSPTEKLDPPVYSIPIEGCEGEFIVTARQIWARSEAPGTSLTLVIYSERPIEEIRNKAEVVAGSLLLHHVPTKIRITQSREVAHRYPPWEAGEPKAARR